MPHGHPNCAPQGNRAMHTKKARSTAKVLLFLWISAAVISIGTLAGCDSDPGTPLPPQPTADDGPAVHFNPAIPHPGSTGADQQRTLPRGTHGPDLFDRCLFGVFANCPNYHEPYDLQWQLHHNW
jgi:hypothetical protein